MSKVLQTLRRLEESRARRAPPAPPRFDPLDLVRSAPPPPAARILPVASGKGGVGKTNVAVNLALALAEGLRGTDARVVLVDADWGLPNADLVLGLRRDGDREGGRGDAPALDDLVGRRAASIADAAVETGHPNLRLVGPASPPSASLARLEYRTRKRFRRQIETLEAAHVVLDLGAGADDSVVEFVSMTNASIVVATPEPPARRDAATLVRRVIMRRLRDETRTLDAVVARLRRLDDGGHDPAIRSVPDLLLSLREDGLAAEEKTVREILGRFRPRLIANRASERDGAETFHDLSDRARRDLGIRLEYLGSVPDDPAVGAAVRSGRPFLFAAPDSPAARAIVALAGRVAGDESFALDANWFSFAEYVRRVFRRP